MYIYMIYIHTHDCYIGNIPVSVITGLMLLFRKQWMILYAISLLTAIKRILSPTPGHL